jgi:putative NADH-flavin reductase
VRIVIFGATGAVGRHLTEQALERDWNVVAFARSPQSLGDLREHVDTIQGNVRDPDAVNWALRDVDAAVSAVGHTDTSQGDVLEVTADHLMQAMHRHGVERLVTLVGTGVSCPKDPSSIGRTVMMSVMRLMVGGMLDDAQRHADLIRDTDLEWTIVRPPRLTDAERTGHTSSGYLKLGPLDSIPRADLADFMLEQVHSDEWLRELPMVAST